MLFRTGSRCRAATGASHLKSLPPASGRWWPLGLLGPLGTVTAAAAAPVGLPTPLMLGAGSGPVSIRRVLRTLRTSSCERERGRKVGGSRVGATQGCEEVFHPRSTLAATFTRDMTTQAHALAQVFGACRPTKPIVGMPQS
jgi:hypothetical protein